MSNLWYIKLMLGKLYLWPQHILRYLFLDTPTQHTTLRLAEFFFGNGIKQITALDLFRECWDPTPYLNDYFSSRYEEWNRRSNSRYMDEYYDMNIGQVVELSGSKYRDQRFVIETEHPVQIAFCDELFSPSVMQKIKALRDLGK